MLVGILSDIHGNSKALHKVLHEAKKLHVEQLVILGDLVGYYYDAVGVYELLEVWNKEIIRGNHEDMLLGILDKRIDPGEIQKKYGSALSIAALSLSAKSIENIRQYKQVNHLGLDGINILMAHGSPWSTNEYIYPDSDVELISRCSMKGFDFVFIGHTHYPLIFKGKNSLVINPGSVGQSRVCGGLADWGILNTKNKVYTQRQTLYDTTDLKKQAKKYDPDIPYLITILERNSQ